jgi:streptogramin lyase
MDAKRLFCLVLLTSLLAACAQPAAMRTPTPMRLADTGLLRLRSPHGIFVDSGDRIYVADRSNSRIVRMDDMNGGNWIACGSWGNGVGQFKLPADVFVDPAGKIYVADAGNNRIVRMDDMNGSNWLALGSAWTTAGGSGSGSGQFDHPTSVLVDSAGRIYVADSQNDRIVRMDDISGSNWMAYGSRGYEVGQFYLAVNVWVDSAARIYAADVTNCRIVRVDDMNGGDWVAYGSSGGGIGEFTYPWDVCMDSAGRIYVADGYTRIVRINDINGTGWTAYGSTGKGVGEFMSGSGRQLAPQGPGGLFVDAAGKIYISDTYNNRIVRMDDMNGTNWTTFP